MSESFESSRASEPAGGLSRIKRAGPQMVLGLLIVVFVLTGWKGRDFGRHWDEDFNLDKIRRPLTNGVFLPGSYTYPGMVFDIGTIALLPETIPILLRTTKELPPSYSSYSSRYQEVVPNEKVAPLVAFASGKTFLLRLRGIFLVLTSLSGVWVFLAVRACKRSSWEGVFAAVVLLSSWEIAYHARWISPDALQMQFAALWLMLFAFALRSSSRALFWLRLAAAAAGLACGTKYQGAILLLPVLIHTFVVARALFPARPVPAIARELTWIVGIFTAIFLVTTPGVILEPLPFWQSVRSVGNIYATGHGGYTVDTVAQHGYRLLVYLTAVLTSHWPILAGVLSICAALGAVALGKNEPLTAALLLCAPLLYVCCAVCCRVMIVRNYLLLAPFVAFFAARGAFHIGTSLAHAVWPRRIMVTCFVVLFSINLIFLGVAARSIRKRAATRFGADIVAYLNKHPRTQYLLSPKVAQAVANERVSPRNATDNADVAQQYMLFAEETPVVDWRKWSCNRLGQYRLVSGPLEVNFDYYPTWEGESRVVELSMRRAREMHLVATP